MWCGCLHTFPVGSGDVFSLLCSMRRISQNLFGEDSMELGIAGRHVRLPEVSRSKDVWPLSFTRCRQILRAKSGCYPVYALDLIPDSTNLLQA